MACSDGTASLTYELYLVKKGKVNLFANFLEGWRKVKWSSVGWAVIDLAVVISFALLLHSILPILFDITWLALLGGGQTNFAIAPATRSSALGIGGTLFGIIFLALLLLMPRITHVEERVCRGLWYRHKIFTQKKYTIQSSLVFGFVHMIMGVSLGTALALSVGGFMFHMVFYREFERKQLQIASIFLEDGLTGRPGPI